MTGEMRVSGRKDRVFPGGCGAYMGCQGDVLMETFSGQALSQDATPCRVSDSHSLGKAT